MKVLGDDHRSNDGAAGKILEAFIHKIEAQQGKQIDPAEAAVPIEAAEQVLVLLDGPKEPRKNNFLVWPPKLYDGLLIRR